LAVFNGNIIDYYWAICWKLSLIVIGTKSQRDTLIKSLLRISFKGLRPNLLYFMFALLGLSYFIINVNSKNPYNNDTISRKDFHYIFDKSILRDYTPNTYYYLAGLMDGDGYL